MNTGDVGTQAALNNLVDYFQTLSLESVAEMATVYSEDAYFCDPFNAVTGIAPIKHIFGEMFMRLHDPRFVIAETIAQENSAILIWDFDFRIKSLKPQLPRRIHGRFRAESTACRMFVSPPTGGLIITAITGMLPVSCMSSFR